MKKPEFELAIFCSSVQIQLYARLPRSVSQNCKICDSGKGKISEELNRKDWKTEVVFRKNHLTRVYQANHHLHNFFFMLWKSFVLVQWVLLDYFLCNFHKTGAVIMLQCDDEPDSRKGKVGKATRALIIMIGLMAKP